MPKRVGRRQPAGVRQDGGAGFYEGGSTVIRYLAVLGVGYVFGTKAGRRRYEQIVGTYRALTDNPATKTVIDAGRRKIADRVSPDPDPKMVTLTEIDSETTVVQSQRLEK
jgi:hypothetical protein